MSIPKISIQIITYNGMKYLPKCLASLEGQTYRDCSVLILDNNSSDETVDFIKQNHPNFKIIENKENLGFAKAHNQGILSTQSEYILCLNQDMFLEPDFLEKVVDFLDSNKEVGALTGKIYRWDFENDKKTNEIDTLGLKIKKNHKVVDLEQGSVDNGKFNLPKEVFGVSGAAPIYRREALESIKINNEYFDEVFFMYKEDVDLSFRLNSAGWKSYYLPTAVAYHDRSTSKNKQFFKNRKQKSSFVNQYSYRNHLIVLIKNIYLENLIIYLPRVFIYEFSKFLYILFFETKTLLKTLDFLRISAKVWQKRRIIIRKRQISAKSVRRWLE